MPTAAGSAEGAASKQLSTQTPWHAARVDDAGTGIGVTAKRPVEIGPPLSAHLPFQSRADVPLGTWSKLKRGPLGGALAKALTDVGAARP